MSVLSLLLKPVSEKCNMRCQYCFYTDEAKNREQYSYGMMSLETLFLIVDKGLDYAEESCSFTFQGGEPMLKGLEFYRKFMAYLKAASQKKGITFSCSMQTNALLVDDEWAQFFADNNFLLGVSLDGVKEIHDKYRVDINGNGTFDRVMQSISILKKHKVEFNILTVITAQTALKTKEIFLFYKEQGFLYQQYLECIDPLRGGHDIEEYSLKSEQLESFLKQMFDLWFEEIENGAFLYNRYFENLAMNIVGMNAESCACRGICEIQWVIEADGSMFPCDFYAMEQWKLGNILTDSFPDMERKGRESGFIKWSLQLHDDCRSCTWFRLCRGGCRKNRESVTEVKSGKNCFCQAYYHFMDYAVPRLVMLMEKRGLIQPTEGVGIQK